jgi:hypothetical protein
MQQEHVPEEAEAMAIAFPAPEAASRRSHERAASEPVRESSRLGHACTRLRRCYERIAFAIFDPDDDCMRL